jgi:hypothetical protein
MAAMPPNLERAPLSATDLVGDGLTSDEADLLQVIDEYLIEAMRPVAHAIEDLQSRMATIEKQAGGFDTAAFIVMTVLTRKTTS